jgi:hypothetical protein
VGKIDLAQFTAWLRRRAGDEASTSPPSASRRQLGVTTGEIVSGHDAPNLGLDVKLAGGVLSRVRSVEVNGAPKPARVIDARNAELE